MEIVTVLTRLIILLYLWINFGYYIIFFIAGKVGYDYATNYKHEEIVKYVDNYKYNNKTIALYILAKGYIYFKYIMTKVKYYVALIAKYLLQYKLTNDVLNKLENINGHYLQYKKILITKFLNDTEIGKEINETEKKFQDLKNDIDDIEKIMKIMGPIINTVEKIDTGGNKIHVDMVKELDKIKEDFDKLFKKSI